MLPHVTVEGRVVNDPDLRFSPSGTAVSNFRIVSSSRKKNDAGEWVDDKTLWLGVTCFKKLAENVVESLRKGDLVVVSGRLQTDEWEKDGQKQSATALVADSVAASLQFRTIPHGESATSTSPPATPAPSTPPQTDEPPF